VLLLNVVPLFSSVLKLHFQNITILYYIILYYIILYYIILYYIILYYIILTLSLWFQNFRLWCSSCFYVNYLPHLEAKTYTKLVREQSAEENVWTTAVRRDKKPERYLIINSFVI